MKGKTSWSVHKMLLTLLIIYILNCSDLLFTYTYLKTGLFDEINPLMRHLLHFPFLTLAIKVLVPALLLLYLFYSFDALTPVLLGLCRIGSLVLLIFYTLLNFTHIYYLFQFLTSSS